ncbi:dnaJ homolog subfamily C member 24-like [Anopheles bellator]|uniref:dnaJ homolog subfamily C member 24-like n=1 Tax=Anopheles bellator TaxID=139047 RepID=UPI00264A100B|nr:dnaJ homolog subfamily C member 24-like [Anopheles bellator]
MSQNSAATNTRQISHYDVLQVANDATVEEIRKAYQTLALQFHPDKRKNDPDSERFIRIDGAWKVLRDEQSRRVYDAELMQRSCEDEYFVNEILTKADFDRNHEDGYNYHACRCGGYYVLPDEPIIEKIYVGCDECSLVVQVNPS